MTGYALAKVLPSVGTIKSESDYYPWGGELQFLNGDSNHCAFSWLQPSQPIDTSLCELYQHPDQYAGKMIRVRGTIAGNDMWIDTFTEKPRPSWMSIVVIFPNQIKSAPGFDLVKDDSFNKFEEAMHHSRPIHIEATFEGRFDSAVTVENGKRIEVGKGYGKKHQHNGRIVLHRVSDVIARPLGRK